MERAEAEAICDQGRDAAVEVLLALSTQNERLTAQVEQLATRVARQEERIAQLERKTKRSSRNSSQPPSADPPGAPPRRGEDPSGRKQGGQPGHEGKGRPLLPAWAVDEVVEHWPTDCACGHGFCVADRVAVVAGAPSGRGTAGDGRAGDRASVPARCLPRLRRAPDGAFPEAVAAARSGRAGQGPEANMSLTCVYTVREGKIHAFEFFRDPAEALEAVGPKDPAQGAASRTARRQLATSFTGVSRAILQR